MALRCTRMSLDFASLVSGTSAPDLAIWVLFSSAMRVSIAIDANQATGIAQWRRECPAGSSGVRTVGSKVGDASDGIALDFHVGAEHLPDKRLQPAQRNNQQLVLRYAHAASVPPFPYLTSTSRCVSPGSTHGSQRGCPALR